MTTSPFCGFTLSGTFRVESYTNGVVILHDLSGSTTISLSVPSHPDTNQRAWLSLLSPGAMFKFENGTFALLSHQETHEAENQLEYAKTEFTPQYSVTINGRSVSVDTIRNVLDSVTSHTYLETPTTHLDDTIKPNNATVPAEDDSDDGPQLSVVGEDVIISGKPQEVDPSDVVITSTSRVLGS